MRFFLFMFLWACSGTWSKDGMVWDSWYEAELYPDTAGDTATDTGHTGDTTIDDSDSAIDTVDTETGGDSETGDTFEDTDTAGPTDLDGDGFDSTVDCNDGNAAINPDADEVCDTVDNDCDGTADEDDATDAGTWYFDGDGDGYGDDTVTTRACEQPSGYVATSGDCVIDDAAYHPGASETDCTDTADYNCDGATGAVDGDGDGYMACEECDDGNADVNPAATEMCDEVGVDENCDGSVNEEGAEGWTTFYLDADVDGYGSDDLADATEGCDLPIGYAEVAGDCDDGNALANPDQTETCATAYDDNCDGNTEDGGDTSLWHQDADSDGYGGASVTTTACAAPTGYVLGNGDCDDADANTFPGAAEVESGTSCMTDADADGYGDGNASGVVVGGSDCDDADAAVNPAAAETCSTAYDDNCDRDTDLGAGDASVWYADADSDSFGNASSSSIACDQPTGYVADATDCDDTSASAYPGADEVAYDSVDQDCDGADVTDADLDGYDAVAAGGSDCDDADAGVNPASTETCDGVDNDCNGTVDDGVGSLTTYYADADGDTYGDPAVSQEACAAPGGYVTNDDDCDDANAAIPAASESRYTAYDDDCDGDDVLGVTFGSITFTSNNLVDAADATFEDGISGAWELIDHFSGLAIGDLAVSDEAFTSTLGTTAAAVAFPGTGGAASVEDVCVVLLAVDGVYASDHVGVLHLFANQSSVMTYGTTVYLGDAADSATWVVAASGSAVGYGTDGQVVQRATAGMDFPDVMICAGNVVNDAEAWVTHIVVGTY